MQYKLSSDFTALTETSGIFYVMPGQSVELAVGSSTPAKDTGFVLRGDFALPFSADGTIYARSRGSYATLNVTEGEIATGITGISSGGSGGQGGESQPDIDTGEITQDDINSLFRGTGGGFSMSDEEF